VKRALVLVALLALATSASAGGWTPVVEPESVRLEIGETRTVTIWGRWSGWMIVPWTNWTFDTTDRNIATADGLMTSSQPHQVSITGVAPGKVYLKVSDFTPTYATIDVACGVEDPIHAADPLVVATVGRPVTLKAITPIAHRTSFTWYLGRMSDQSSPLNASGSELSFTPIAGTQYVWVVARTVCSFSLAEFRVEGRSARQRTVRR
jgi:hypothetical protein